MKEITAAGWIGEDRKAALSGKIGQILDHPDVKPFFRDGLTIKNEAEILLKDGTVYRPDRVIIENGTVTVLDYKTGKKKEKHREQLLGYEKYLLEMGYQKVSKYLLYLDPQIDLEEIP
jgi:ATP-dependent exoDNAse (exonuclease V) beta subunit